VTVREREKERANDFPVNESFGFGERGGDRCCEASQ